MKANQNIVRALPSMVVLFVSITAGCDGRQHVGSIGSRISQGDASSACVPTTCSAAGANCGQIADGCGGLIDCGACPAPDTCGGGGTANVCGTPATAPDAGQVCTPTTCAQRGATCGVIPDGCGGVLDCGACPAPDTCGGGGTANVCGTPATAPDAGQMCTPATCAQRGATCGAIQDGCGGVLECGACPPPTTCGGAGVANACG
jgi:hypothetical protein